jgi:hypothetical protein
MKTISIRKIIMLLLVFAGLSLSAQDGSNLKNSTPEERAQFQTEWMKKKLALDAAQIEQVQSINEKYARKNDPVLKGDAGKLSKFKQLKSLQKEKDFELKRVLTGEQFKMYESIQAEIKSKMKEMRNK